MPTVRVGDGASRTVQVPSGCAIVGVPPAPPGVTTGTARRSTSYTGRRRLSHRAACSLALERRLESNAAGLGEIVVEAHIVERDIERCVGWEK